MAQHDMNIANQGFPATRADINNALQALASNNSGTSAPSTTFANQWWYDEANNKLYIRNEANNAWIQVAVLDQTNNEWQITTGVVQAKDSDGLALKTDDGTTRLFIKDSNGYIGINSTSPDNILHIRDTVASFGLQSDDGQLAQIVFGDASDSSRGRIYYDSSENMVFETNNLVQRLLIGPTGVFKTRDYAIDHNLAGSFAYQVRAGVRQGTGSYILFTNGSASTQSSGIVHVHAINGTPSQAKYWKYVIGGNRTVNLLSSGDSGSYGGATPSIGWSGDELQAVNTDGNTFYAVKVELFNIGNGWAATFGNFPGFI